MGTRISGWLGDDLDIQAVLSGLSGRDALRGMLARLPTEGGSAAARLGRADAAACASHAGMMMRFGRRCWEEGGKKSEAQNLKELGF